MKNIILLFFCIVLFFVPSVQGSRQLNTVIEIGENGINLFLNEQYNQLGFKRNIAGNIGDITYNITLQLPYIRLLDNSAKVYFGFKIQSNIYNGWIEFEDNVSFSIPSIDNLTVKGLCENFRAKVNSSNLNSVLKSVIIGAWDGLQLEVYPMSLAKKLDNSVWFAERAINIVDPFFSIGFKSVVGKLQITLGTYLKAREYFVIKGFLDNRRPYIMVSCGTQVTVKEIQVYDLSGRLYGKIEDAGVCPKNGLLNISASCLNYFTYNQYFIVKVLFTTAETFHVRNYKCLLGATVNPNKSIN